VTEVLEMEAGPDWLTVTTANVADTQVLRRVADWFLFAEPGARTWRTRDYCGRKNHYANGSGGVAYGERDLGQQAILQAWGDVSLKVGLRMPARRFKATRVDLAVTILFSQPQPSIRERLPELEAHAARQSYSAIVPISDAGGTLYVGSRSSDMFGRLYDKGSQLGGAIPPRVLWRYEVEYKRQSAVQAANEVWYSQPSPDARRRYIVRNVEHFFNAHAVPMPVDVQTGHQHGLIRYGARVQDYGRTLQWLSNQVNPAILNLCAIGKKSDVLQALGLNIRDGVPDFETAEVVPPQQLSLWPGIDFPAD